MIMLGVHSPGSAVIWRESDKTSLMTSFAACMQIQTDTHTQLCSRVPWFRWHRYMGTKLVSSSRLTASCFAKHHTNSQLFNQVTDILDTLTQSHTQWYIHSSVYIVWMHLHTFASVSLSKSILAFLSGNKSSDKMFCAWKKSMPSARLRKGKTFVSDCVQLQSKKPTSTFISWKSMICIFLGKL